MKITAKIYRDAIKGWMDRYIESERFMRTGGADEVEMAKRVMIEIYNDVSRGRYDGDEDGRMMIREGMKTIKGRNKLVLAIQQLIYDKRKDI